MVYVILVDNMSGAEEKACKSLLRERMLEVSEDMPALMQEQEALWKQDE